MSFSHVSFSHLQAVLHARSPTASLNVWLPLKTRDSRVWSHGSHMEEVSSQSEDRQYTVFPSHFWVSVNKFPASFLLWICSLYCSWSQEVCRIHNASLFRPNQICFLSTTAESVWIPTLFARDWQRCILPYLLHAWSQFFHSLDQSIQAQGKATCCFTGRRTGLLRPWMEEPLGADLPTGSQPTQKENCSRRLVRKSSQKSTPEHLINQEERPVNPTSEHRIASQTSAIRPKRAFRFECRYLVLEHGCLILEPRNGRELPKLLSYSCCLGRLADRPFWPWAYSICFQYGWFATSSSTSRPYAQPL